MAKQPSASRIRPGMVLFQVQVPKELARKFRAWVDFHGENAAQLVAGFMADKIASAPVSEAAHSAHAKPRREPR